MTSAKNDFVTGTKSCTLTNIKNALKSKTHEEQLAFHEFDLNELCENPFIGIIGKRGCGKSFAIKNIIKHQIQNEKIDEIMVFSSVDKYNSIYSEFVENVQHTLDFNVISQILQIQEENRNNNINKNFLIVLDDCCGQKGEWLKNQGFQELLFNGRHHKISVIFSMQFPLGLSPELRCNFDYMFLFKDDIISNIKRMYDHYAGAFPTFDSFRQVFRSLTSDFSSMVVVNRGVKKTIEEKIKWFKATQVNFTGLIPAIFKQTMLIKNIHTHSTTNLEKIPKKKKTYKISDDINDTFILESGTSTPTKKPLSFSNIKSFIDDDASNDSLYDMLAPDSLYDLPNTFNHHQHSLEKIDFGMQKKYDYAYQPYNKQNTNNNENDTNVVQAMIGLYDHLKNDIKNKNKYDVMYEIVQCNTALIKNGLLLSENKINTIIEANLKIAELCGINENISDINLELDEIKSEDLDNDS